MKPHCTLTNMLLHPNDMRDPLNTKDVIYSVPCKNCPVSYIGETGKKFGKRLEEHRAETEKKLSYGIRATRKDSHSVVHKSAISDQVVNNNHLIDWSKPKIIGKEINRDKRWIKKALLKSANRWPLWTGTRGNIYQVMCLTIF